VSEPTARELQVLVAIIETGSEKDAAKRLGIAPATVNAHTDRIRHKLDAASTAQAFGIACSRGLIDPFRMRFGRAA
jgi:DNA-binding NarL/FixJ family response regulator